VLIAGLSPGRSYTFIVHAENGVSDQSNDNRQQTSVTVSTHPAGAWNINYYNISINSANK